MLALHVAARSASEWLVTMLSKWIRSLLLIVACVAGSALADEATLWFNAGKPTAEARQAVDILLSAAHEGLSPDDYQAAWLDAQLSAAQQGAVLSDAELGAIDATLTSALQRYLTELRNGRIDPRQIHVNFEVPLRAPFDANAFLLDAVAQGRLPEALRDVTPRLPMYAELRQALAQYRALADHPAWQTPLPPLPRRKLETGQAYAGLTLLVQRLVALGDLPEATPVPERFDGLLVTGLQAFQARHGLDPDGVLGRATLQQLNVTPAERVRQIELSLERLRWTPLLNAPRMIVVNVPEFVLRAYEVQDEQVKVQVTMKVIVGKALDTHTPLFDADMRFIEFSPYWNVPPSIAREETVPKIRRTPAYFREQGFEFVTPGGQVLTTLASGYLDAVLQGGWRIRQRPGPKNALGDIKFVFPNHDNIYLHHTPAPQLFERERRDYSHGCIRVQEPVALARFVLQDQPEWTVERIQEAMAKGESRTLRLKQPLRVLIAYSTVVVKGGRVYFYPDLYGHDAMLDQALRERATGLPPRDQPKMNAE